MFKRIILLILLLPVFLLAGCASSDLIEIPKDFKIVAITGGFAPGTSICKLEMDAQGNCVYYESTGIDRINNTFKQIETFKISKVALEYIYESIKENDFFSLEKNYIKKSVLDGNFAELSVTESNKTHTVRTQNIKVKRFDNIMTAINITTPGMDKVMYNEINWFNR